MDTLVNKAGDLPTEIPGTTMAYPIDSQAVVKRVNIFSDMCGRLLNNIIQKIIIQERSLRDFSKLVLWIVDDVVETLPESFNELADYISDYWRYELKNEPDSERKYSYIRLYQMINVIKTLYAERELEDKALFSLEKNSSNIELLRLVQRSPGITHKRLWEMLDIPSVELQNQLEPLEKEGFISGRRFGEERYYMLTNAGEVLYQNLSTQGRRSIWSAPWSDDRTLVLLFALEIQRERGITGIQILETVQMVTECNNDLIAQIAKIIFRTQQAPQQENISGYMRNTMVHNTTHYFWGLQRKSLSRIELSKSKEPVFFSNNRLRKFKTVDHTTPLISEKTII